ncbi:MAG: DHH family phosphoesterase [Candidatus Moranbacteria bacterium]|nr:DHH family phosphoesterase [Candidatus Moranbacteria bacterium]
MSLNLAQQFEELLQKASHPLIIVTPHASLDAVSTAVALALFFEKIGKKATLAGDTLLRDLESLSILERPTNIRESITASRDFVLAFNTEYNNIVNITSERLPKEFRIYLTPEKGTIDPRDFSFIPAQFIFDLAIVLGASDKERCGKIYENDPDIFYEMPVVNIDNQPANENFGQFNAIDLKASSLAEIVADLFLASKTGALPDVMALPLLTGIIAATDSFQRKNTTPKSLQLASVLMQMGADQQRIIRSLYKTQPLHLIKLWGKAMAQIKSAPKLDLVWSLVTTEDIVHARAEIDDLPLILEKIKANSSQAKFFALLSPENTSTVRVLIKSASREAFEVLLERLPNHTLLGDTILLLLPAGSLEEAEQILFEKLEVALL